MGYTRDSTSGAASSTAAGLPAYLAAVGCKCSRCSLPHSGACLCLVGCRIAKDPRFERITCDHKGTYADDCLVNRVTEVRAWLACRRCQWHACLHSRAIHASARADADPPTVFLLPSLLLSPAAAPLLHRCDVRQGPEVPPAEGAGCPHHVHQQPQVRDREAARCSGRRGDAVAQGGALRGHVESNGPHDHHLRRNDCGESDTIGRPHHTSSRAIRDLTG